MKNHVAVSAIVVLVVAVVLGSVATAQGSDDSRSVVPSSGAVNLAGSDSQPTGAPEVVIPEKYRATEGVSADAVAPVPVVTLYFTPQDENTSTTVIFVYNTGAAAATVGLRTYGITGASVINTSFSVPAGGLVRICADTVSTIAGTWQDVLLVNFTTNSTYGRMTLPPGVKAEAYVVWNDAGTFDPLKVSPTLPIRFSTDQGSVFLPAALRAAP